MPSSTILIVDDDPVILRFVSANFQARQFKVLLAEDGESALEMIEQNRTDLVILDYMMLGIDGFEVCRRIREWSRVPVLMLSAKAEQGTKVTALEIGADDYMTKPFIIKELLARVDALLRRSGNQHSYDSPVNQSLLPTIINRDS
ncbi:MAG: response regulator transcription factor [Planctomycetes bacterium]|nr:response regulator transcription factor [Planctomycetota bacterium]